MEQAITVTDVSEDDIDTLWPGIKGHLELAIERAQGEYALEDIHAFLLSGSMRLWIAYDDDGVLQSSAICQLRTYPKKTICYVVLAAGGAFDIWTTGFDALEEWAMANGATDMAAYTRRGVAKRAKEFGYNEVYVVIQKSLTDRRLH